MTPTTKDHSAFIRYFLVSLSILAWDALVTFVVFILTNTFWLAISTGYLSSLVIAYIIHQKWTFKSNKATTPTRCLLYVTIVIFVGLTRIPTAYTATYIGFTETIAWVFSIAISFVLNYALLSTFFANKAPNHDSSKIQKEQPNG